MQLKNPDHKGTEFFASLEGMRGIAALGVVFYHVEWHWHLYGLEIVRNGRLFVDLFFIISGFVISHIYAARLNSPRALAEFAVLRTARLYPLHFFTLLLIAGITLSMPWLTAHWSALPADDPRLRENTLNQFLQNLFLVHALVPGHHFSFNRPSWSISVEYFTYFLFAILAVLTFGRKSLMVAASALVAGASVLYLWHRGALTVNISLLRCFTGFFIGVLLQFLWQRVHSGAREMLEHGWKAHIAETLCLALIIAAMTYGGHRHAQFLVLPAFALGVWLFSLSHGWVTRVLESRWIQNLGKWSYSIYMVHFSLLLVATDTLRVATRIGDTARHVRLNVWEVDAVGATFIALVLIMSSLTYRFIEVPPRTLAKHWVARWKMREPAGTISSP
ncbi:MAG: acyltransferase family protein [Bacillota bacterium]